MVLVLMLIAIDTPRPYRFVIASCAADYRFNDYLMIIAFSIIFDGFLSNSM